MRLHSTMVTLNHAGFVRVLFQNTCTHTTSDVLNLPSLSDAV